MRIRLLTAAGLASVALLASAGTAAADGPDTVGVAKDSPGFLSGNVVQVPIDVNVNACGNTIGLVNVLSPAIGNTCVISD
ncbi:chaplin [Streptomyces sp. NPDC052013]|uniref:chaplin n=1 Tax=unclassified Streptomyces TaxID=2593676 RepID=UPI00344FDD3B